MNALNKSFTLKQIKVGIPVVVKGHVQFKKIKIKGIDKFRKKYENDYVRDMLEMVKAINPEYESKVKANKSIRLGKPELKLLSQYLASANWDSAFQSIISSRTEISIEEIKSNIEKIQNDLGLFKRGYEYLIWKILLKDISRTLTKKMITMICTFLYI